MKRSIWWRCFKASYVYSTDDIIQILGISRNTVSNHIKQGLRAADNAIPKLFNGAELIRFHKDRTLSFRRNIRPGEFNCFKCRTFVLPEPETLEIEQPSDTARRHFTRAMAVCPQCSGRLSRIVSETECANLKEARDSKSSWDSQDEYTARFPAEIWNEEHIPPPAWNKTNERLIHDLIIYCRRFNSKTTDAILITARELEAFHGKKDFKSYTIEDIDRYRSDLRRRANCAESDRLSSSTLRHRASHARRILNWLINQNGMERLPRSLPEYIVLSKADTARSFTPEPKRYPTDEEAVLLVSQMPIKSFVQRRDRAIVATSLLLGTRADATASLLIKHIDLQNRCAYQIATESRIKNSKTQTTYFFPGDPAFEQTVKNWVEEMNHFGARGDDALFPPDHALGRIAFWLIKDRKPIAPWATSGGIEKAFRRSCEAANLPYFNPHSARHNVFLRRDSFCSTGRQRKAWSHNAGHESEVITERAYAKISNEECRNVFSELAQSNGETLDDKDLMIDFQLGELTPGTPEHERAKRLIRARMDRN